MRRQIGEAITWFIVVAIIGGFAVLVAGIWIKQAKAYEYKPKDYTKQQKIWQGKTKKKNIQHVDLPKELNQKLV